jgi:hypothetical protein
MPADSVQPTPSEATVVLDEDHVLIHNLSVDGALAALVRVAIDEGRDPEDIVRQALEIGAAMLAHGVAKGTVDAVSTEVDRLLAVLDAKSSNLEVMRRGRLRDPARGLSFENELGAVLDACFAPHSDILEATGAMRGIADAKVGDFVVTLNPRDTGGGERRVVFEAKDRPLGMTKALAELDAAKLNRGAQVAVMVFARRTQAPLRGRPLRVFPGNRILVVWDKDGDGDLALEVAAQLARTLAITVERDDAKLNRRALKTRIDALLTVIEHAEAIGRGIGGARRGLDTAEDAYKEMRAEALALLYELQDRL